MKRVQSAPSNLALFKHEKKKALLFPSQENLKIATIRNVINNKHEDCKTCPFLDQCSSYEVIPPCITNSTISILNDEITNIVENNMGDMIPVNIFTKDLFMGKVNFIDLFFKIFFHVAINYLLHTIQTNNEQFSNLIGYIHIFI